MRKKLIILLLLITIFVGCTPQKNSSKQPVVFSVLYNNTATAPFRSDWHILEEYQKQKNVVLDVQLGDNSDYEKSIIQALESGDAPDIILKVWPNSIKNYANAGILLPFSDYEHLMPHFMEYIGEHDLADEMDTLRLVNGKYYILPGYQRKIQVQQWIYRQDVFDKHNLNTPKNYDELFESLVMLKEIYPESNPLTACWNGAHLFAMMGAGYGIPAGWAGTRYYNEQEDRWQFSPATENYREMYTFLTRCYEAGILDSAIFTQTDVDYFDKLGDGSTFVTVTWITSGFGPWNEKLKENGYTNDKWSALPVPESTIGIQALPPINPFRKGLIVPSSVVNEPYFEDLLEFLDWAVYSEEGRTLTTWGIEGLTYEITQNGKTFLPTIKTSKNPEGTIEISKEFGFDTLFNLNENEEFEDYKKPDEITTFLNRSLKAGEVAAMPPALNLDTHSIETIYLINEKLEPYVADSSTKFITGELSIKSTWDEYLTELENRGYKVLEVIWNDAWSIQDRN